MIKVLMFLSTIALAGVGSLPVQAADRVQAEHFAPKHVLATTRPNIQCPQGYSRLFGKNPPTCYETCPQGWTVQSNVTTGAVCVRCPQGYVPSYGGSGQWCSKPGPIVPEKEKPAPGGLWGQ